MASNKNILKIKQPKGIRKQLPTLGKQLSTEDTEEKQLNPTLDLAVKKESKMKKQTPNKKDLTQRILSYLRKKGPSHSLQEE